MELLKDRMFKYICKFGKKIPGFPTVTEISGEFNGITPARVYKVLSELTEDGKIDKLSDLGLQREGYRLKPQKKLK